MRTVTLTEKRATLSGSEKQVEWAESIREEYAASFRELFSQANTIFSSPAYAKATEEEQKQFNRQVDVAEFGAKEILEYETTASWYIDNEWYCCTPKVLLHRLETMYSGRKLGDDKDKLIVPPNANGIHVNVQIWNDDLVVVKSVKSDLLIDILKDHGFWWNGRNGLPAWVKVASSEEKKHDVISRVAKALLDHGFSVRGLDQSIQRKLDHDLFNER